MAVVWMCVGAPVGDGVTVAARVDTGPVRVAVSTNEGMAGATLHGPESVDASGVAKVAITGLTPRGRYYYQVEDDGVLDTSTTGQFITAPAAGDQASFRLGLAGDAGLDPEHPGVAGGELAPDRLSNHPVFATIRDRAVAENWATFVHLGDLHYYDLGSDQHGISGGASEANYRASYDDVLAQPRQGDLYRDVPWQYIWDDHDFGPNNSDGTHTGKANALAAYEAVVPHAPLGGTDDGIYHSLRLGRVLVVAWDVRYNRSPNGDTDDSSKTMLGQSQKDWFENLLATSDAEVLVILSGSQWIATSADSWGSFATERDEIAAMVESHGWGQRTVICYGDRHAIGITGGQSNDWGGWPAAMLASLDASPSAPTTAPDRYEAVSDQPGRGQYGTIDVQDVGGTISVTLTAWRGSSDLGSYTMAVSLASTPETVATVSEFADVVSGSHIPVIEARYLADFQAGADPDGDVLQVMAGDVKFDATADVFASLEMQTPGVDVDTGRSRFPRLQSDALAPFGAEVFIRRGVDVGDAILWSPLGYFRLDAVEQDDGPDGPIRLSGQDRWVGLDDAKLLRPREYAPSTQIAAIVSDLVGDVYPDATVAFDDDSAFADIGRTLVAEESRTEVLREVADSLGKIIYWDGEGVLQIRDAPEESDPVWSVRAGHGGVLVTAGRRVSREGVYNAVVATGEGGDTETPVRAVAMDVGPNSPTRWAGRFGRVPEFFSSPMVRTQAQADRAARQRLRRQLGMPHNADFGAIVNPALRPWDVVRVQQRDGNRQVHVIERLTIPLTADAAMQAETKERTQVVIGAVVE